MTNRHDNTTVITMGDVADAVRIALQENNERREAEQRTINSTTHNDHHEFITVMIPFVEMMMRREARNTARWEKFTSSLVGALTVTLVAGLGWLGSILIEGIKAHFRVGG